MPSCTAFVLEQFEQLVVPIEVVRGASLPSLDDPHVACVRYLSISRLISEESVLSSLTSSVRDI